MTGIAVRYDAHGVQVMLKAALQIKSHDLVMRRVEEGVHRAGRYMLPLVRQALREQTRLKARIVSGATKGYVPSGERGVYQISATGKGPYIAGVEGVRGSKRDGVRWSPRLHWKAQGRDGKGRFTALPKDDGKGAVSAMSWGVAHNFKRSFVNANGKFVAALPGAEGKRVGIRMLRGPAPWKELVKDQTLATFEAKAPALMDREVGIKLARLLP